MLSNEVNEKNARALNDEQVRQLQTISELQARVELLEQSKLELEKQLNDLRVMVVTKLVGTGPTSGNIS